VPVPAVQPAAKGPPGANRGAARPVLPTGHSTDVGIGGFISRRLRLELGRLVPACLSIEAIDVVLAEAPGARHRRLHLDLAVGGAGTGGFSAWSPLPPPPQNDRAASCGRAQLSVELRDECWPGRKTLESLSPEVEVLGEVGSPRAGPQKSPSRTAFSETVTIHCPAGRTRPSAPAVLGVPRTPPWRSCNAPAAPGCTAARCGCRASEHDSVRDYLGPDRVCREDRAPDPRRHRPRHLSAAGGSQRCGRRRTAPHGGSWATTARTARRGRRVLQRGPWIVTVSEKRSP